jgi:hypothetical protein
MKPMSKAAVTAIVIGHGGRMVSVEPVQREIV